MADQHREPPWPDNRVAISGTLLEDPNPGATPAGIPVVRFVIEHASEPVEAGKPRRIAFRLGVRAVGAELVRRVAMLKAGDSVHVTGFMARSDRRDDFRLTLCARRIELPGERTRS